MEIHPTREEFLALARTGNLVPVYADLMADFETPVSAYSKLRGHGPAYLLESVEGGENLSRYSFIGCRPRKTFACGPQTTEIREAGRPARTVPTPRDPLALIEAELRQFRPIARFTADPTVFVVRADAPWQTLQDFIADAKKNPGTYNYGSSGNYGTMHVPMEMLKAEAGFRMTHIPFTGAGPAVVALLGGQVDALASGPASVVQHINAGRLRALAHWGEHPLVALPTVPSLKQLGYPASFAQWSALFVPAGTPDEIVQKLRAAAQRVATDPAVKDTIARAGSPIEYLDAPEFQAYWDADAATMTQVVRRIGRVE